MSLRARLLSGFTVILALTVGAAVTVVVSQREQLIDQIDDQLTAIAPLIFPPGGQSAEPGQGPAPPGSDTDSPVSNVYAASVSSSGSVTVLQVGQLLTDQPDLQAIDITNSDVRTFLNLKGSSTFRVLVLPSLPGFDTQVIAMPLDDVEQTVSRLVYTFALLSGLIATALALLGWWLIRLGLNPIAEMTKTAEAITSGQSSRRATEFDDSTEAGKLAKAFNLMLDQRDEADERLRQFVADASHELRTPLTSIRGYLDLYTEGGFREPGQLDDVIARMQSESARMTSLVEDLLTLANLDEQRSLSKSSADVGSLMAACVQDTLAAHPKRTIICTKPAVTLTLDADPMRLQQVILILLDNAVAHTPDDCRISVHATERSSSIEIVISDNGPGMSNDVAKKAFERFYRGDPARSRSSGGSGLGLAIAKSIVEIHGGSLTLVSASGEGCTFTICLPKTP